MENSYYVDQEILSAINDFEYEDENRFDFREKRNFDIDAEELEIQLMATMDFRN